MRSSPKTYIFIFTAVLIVSALVSPLQAIKNSSAKTAQPNGMVEPPVSYTRQRGTAQNSNDPLAQLFAPARNKGMFDPSPRYQSPEGQGEAVTYTQEAVVPSEFNGDVRNLPPVPSKLREEMEPENPEIFFAGPTGEGAGANIPVADMPSPIQNFEGLAFNTAVTGGQAGGGSPPDINGDVGPNHYIEAVNNAYAIYDKSGTRLAAFTENSLWSGQGVGTACNANNFGDPVVVYDQFADRWILTNLGLTSTSTGPFYQCFAVSKTGDPVAGGWWFYALRMDPGGAGLPPVNTLNDYGKFGSWNDGCLYMGANGFLNGGSYNGAIFASFNKADMESGAPLTWSLGFIPTTSNPISMFPSNISGAKAAANVPPAGTPSYFVNQSNIVNASFEVRRFTPGTTPKICGGGGTMGTAISVTHAAFTSPASVAQPGTATTLDSLGSRIMQKVQYRKVGAAESLWAVHTVRPAGAPNGPQWVEMNVTGGTIQTTPVQEQIYTPEATLNRWMGSLAVDRLGNMALGYSTGNATAPNFASIAYSGRLVTDTPNMLPQSEVQLFAGTGAHTSNTRWGDYTAMSVDPTDDCTFWYTNMYYAAGSGSVWHTRIGSFKFPNCIAAAPATISGTIATGGSVPVGGVVVKMTGAATKTTITDAAGNYHFDNVAVGNSYTITPALANYTFAPVNRGYALVGNVTDATFTANANASQTANAIDTNEFFVRQHYLDFLGREPDQDGLDYWSGQINQCGANTGCTFGKRIDVSAAFFISGEFQDTGSFVYNMYAALLGRTLSFSEFSTDRAQVVGGGGLDAAKTAFAQAYVQRAEFTTKYPLSMTRDQFVDAVILNMQTRTGGNYSSLRTGFQADYDASGRFLVARHAAEASAFVTAEYNKAFVLMQYYGYLRRGIDQTGYDFWLNVLNNNPTNFRGMVCSFLTSAEYQNRFSTVVTHNNNECNGVQ